ncbi:putative plus-end-directed kinesin ATPase [Helianthus debilis subsp. tardiflorus]
MIILDVPTVRGRLMLVDMAGSENIEQAGQIGFEAKMQTAKINQGNTALKRVVESIANGDSHVSFRDSKLTMFLQDSFEYDKSKILMILCASPDPKEMHKTYRHWNTVQKPNALCVGLIRQSRETICLRQM